MAKFLQDARAVASTILDISYTNHAGHIGSALSISDLVSGFYFTRKKTHASDRFILSKGHAGAALYSALYHSGVLSKKELMSFADDAGGLCEHPDSMTPGVEMTSGSLGHGLAFGVGVALGEQKNNELRVTNKDHNSKFVIRNSIPHIFVLISDGECGEGSIWEAAILASRMKLDNLTVLVDYNGWQCFGKTSEITHLDPIESKWKAFGWSVQSIDGHNLGDIDTTYQRVPFEKGKPSVIIARTIAGHGVSSIENQLLAHYKILSQEEYKQAKEDIQKTYKPKAR